MTTQQKDLGVIFDQNGEMVFQTYEKEYAHFESMRLNPKYDIAKCSIDKNIPGYNGETSESNKIVSKDAKGAIVIKEKPTKRK